MPKRMKLVLMKPLTTNTRLGHVSNVLLYHACWGEEAVPSVGNESWRRKRLFERS